jgi:hypothetical protein
MAHPVFQEVPGHATGSPRFDENRLLPAMADLAADLMAARARGDEPWQRAPTLTDLCAAGLTAADCLALISEGLLAALPARSQHRRAGRSPSAFRSGRSDGRQKSRPAKKTLRAAAYKPAHLGPRTRLTLTDAGLALITEYAQFSRVSLEPASPGSGERAGSHVANTVPGPSATILSLYKQMQGECRMKPSHSGKGQGEASSLSATSSTSLGSPAISLSPLPLSPCPSAVIPRYDIDLRELSVAGVVILRLPVQARNLAAALTALELSGWRSRVAKPLNGCRGGNDHHHVGIAAYKLHHRQSLIEFHADDGGLRWKWRSVEFSAHGSDKQNGRQT